MAGHVGDLLVHGHVGHDQDNERLEGERPFLPKDMDAVDAVGHVVKLCEEQLKERVHVYRLFLSERDEEKKMAHNLVAHARR